MADKKDQWEEEFPPVPAVPESHERAVVMRSASGSEVTTTAGELRELTLDQLQSILGPVSNASEAIGTDQFGPILEDKHQLVGQPFVVVHWEFYDGDFGQFVSMWVMDKDGRRFLVNDGSTGIYAQLRKLTSETGQDSMLKCPYGLRVSVYDKTLPSGAVVNDAETFYIDTKL